MIPDLEDTLGRCEHCGRLTWESQLINVERELLCANCVECAKLEYEPIEK